MIPIPFCGSAYTLDSVNISAQRCLNFYPEINQNDSKNTVTLKPTPGLKLFTTLTGGGVIRCIYTASNNRFFGVCGNKLNEIYTNGTVVERGTLNSTDGIVRMSDNGMQLIVVDGNARDGFIFTFTTNVFAEITDADYPGGSHVVFMDQFFLINKPNTKNYQWCALTDGADWPALNIGSAEANPDNINSMISLGGELWIFGSQSFEVAHNTGDANDTFLRIPGTANNIGCIAPNSLARSDKNVFWLGGDDSGHGIVYVNEGYQARRISTQAIEQAIQRYSKLDDAIAYCYQQLGHEFYVLNFPTASKTWVFDLSTGMWHERCWTDTNNNQYMIRGIVQDFFNGEVYIGDWLSANIYELDPDTYTDDSYLIHRERSSPHIWNNLERSFYTSFQLDVETGVGLVSGQGENPQIMLQISDDGGHTYKPNELWRSAGKLGEYKKRVKWDRLGSSRDRVFKIKVTDPVKWVILGAYVEIE